MKAIRKLLLTFLPVFFFLLPPAADGQWLTIARKVRSMRSNQADIATVIIDAQAFRVYKAVIDTLTSDAGIKVIKRDNSERQVEFTKGNYSLSMKVDSLANGLSQITVSATHSDNTRNQPTDKAVEAILTVCHKAGINCKVDGL